MAMAVGSVTVNNDLSRTGSGMALALYDARRPSFDSMINSTNNFLSSPSAALIPPATVASMQAQLLTALQGLATACTQDATGIVNYIVANAVVSTTTTIHTTDAGLQRDNTGGNPATLAPTANKTLSGTGTVA